MPPTLQLQVDRGELLQALKSVKQLFKRKSNTDAILSFDGETLRIETLGMSLGVAAHGEWSGSVRFPCSFLQIVAAVPPDTDPVSVSVVNGRLQLNRSFTPCVWEDDAANHISLPLNAPFTMVLSVAYHYTPDDIEKSGLKDLVAEAEQTRDSLVSRSHSALEVFGITRAELRALVDEKMRRTPRP